MLTLRAIGKAALRELAQQVGRIIDPVRKALSGDCLLTVSLTDKLSESKPYCFKLVAGVIEKE